MRSRRKRAYLTAKTIEKRQRAAAWRKLSQELRAEVGQCEVCGSSENLCVHHILEKRMWPSLWLDKDDLIVLCRKCHFKVHHHQAFELHAWLWQHKRAQFEHLAKVAQPKFSAKKLSRTPPKSGGLTS